jgi:hypothetical protein
MISLDRDACQAVSPRPTTRSRAFEDKDDDEDYQEVMVHAWDQSARPCWVLTKRLVAGNITASGTFEV